MQRITQSTSLWRHTCVVTSHGRHVVRDVGVVDEGLEGNEVEGLVIGNVEQEASVGRLSRRHFSSRKPELQISDPWKIDDDVDDDDDNVDDDDDGESTQGWFSWIMVFQEPSFLPVIFHSLGKKHTWKSNCTKTSPF